MTQEQSILSNIMTLFAVEKIILQHNVLGYRTDAYFPKYKLAIEVDEQGHNDRDIDYKIERQKAIENKLGPEFIRINPAKKNFNIFVKSTKKLTEESTKKFLIEELSNKLLRLEFKSNNSIKTKCFKKILPTMKLRTYWLACRKHTNNIASRKVTMTNKVVRDKSRCGECLCYKSRFLNKNPIKKLVNNIIKQTC